VTQLEEARRLVLERVDAGDLRAAQAAEVLGVSERHVWRSLAAYRARGAPALAHGNSGRRPHNVVPDSVAATVVRFARDRYPGANHTHLSELLWEHEGLALSRFTVRRILEATGMSSPRRRPPEHRVRREQMPREEMLLQVDGSHHAWLEARGPRFTLLLAVDDATGDVPYALFRPAEDARGYFSLLEQVVVRRGLPLALYTDRHGVFQAPRGRAGRRPPTQFARALGELGITQVIARSPQAKGRVERFAGTLQDRLVTELRHAGASTSAEAQEVLDGFLPGFNTSFRVQPTQSEPAYRPLEPSLDLGAILAFRHPRTVARDNTVKYRWRTLQLLPGPERTSYARSRVEVVERADGSLSVPHHGAPIASRLALPPAGTLRTARVELASHPDYERIVAGRGSGGALPQSADAPSPDDASVHPARNGAAPQPALNGRPLLTPLPRGDSLEQISAEMQAEIDRLAPERVWERFATEGPLLRPLPAVAFEPRRMQPVSVNRSAMVCLEGACALDALTRWVLGPGALGRAQGDGLGRRLGGRLPARCRAG